MRLLRNPVFLSVALSHFIVDVLNGQAGVLLAVLSVQPVLQANALISLLAVLVSLALLRMPQRAPVAAEPAAEAMETLATLPWGLIILGALWVGGLSLVLAAASFASYEAGQSGRGLRQVLAGRGYQAALWGGLALFCAGQLGGGAWWERVLWGGLMVGSAVMGWKSLSADDADGRR